MENEYDDDGRELPVEVAASVMFLISMGHDVAAHVLRNGWFGSKTEETQA